MKRRPKRADPLLVLDLDETLVHAWYSCDEAPRPHDFTICRGPHVDDIDVALRPGLRPFLDVALSTWHVGVWSAGTVDYVDAVLRALGVAGEMAFAWGRSRCGKRTLTRDELKDSAFDGQRFVWVKDVAKLRRVGWDPARLLFVENSPENLRRNYGNAIAIPTWVGSADDDALTRLTPHLRSWYKAVDVRDVEKRGWT